MELTQNEIQQLALIDRQMDSGERPYVKDKNGVRWAFPQEAMDECGLITGQTVSDHLLMIVMQTNISQLQTQIALDKAKTL